MGRDLGEDGGSGESADSIFREFSTSFRMLELNKDVLDILFPRPRLIGGTPDEYVNLKIDRVSMVVYPLGTAVLRIKMDWIARNDDLDVEELIEWVHASKYLQRSKGSFLGWVLNSKR